VENQVSKTKKVVIIGAGMGGLATALRLRHRGFDVTVLEKCSRPGGRSNMIQEGGFRVDTGPTILVMKETIEETYRAIGQDLDSRVKFIRLDPNYRIYYHDGTSLELFSDSKKLSAEVERIQAGSADRLRCFMLQSEKKYRLGMTFVDRNYDRLTDLINPAALFRLVRTKAYQNLYHQVDSVFGSDKLNKAFSFHSMFLGLSPFEAPAMYSLITYADLALGMWYPLGGIYSLVEDMVALAVEMGVDLRLNTPVAAICVKDHRTTGVRLESGSEILADIVVSNADLPYTYRKLIDARFRKDYPDHRLDSLKYACSGFLLYLGVNRTYSHLRHQSLYFAQDYHANLDAIFHKKTIPQEPSFHMSIPSLTDTNVAPPGHTLIYLLAPMPNLQADIDWRLSAPIVRESLIERLEAIVDPDIRKHIVWERNYSPPDYQRDFNAEWGTAFGSLSHGFFQSSYFRPHNKARDINGLYFVGQGTYPGIGIPMVHLSAKLVSERIIREWT
jgi:phytoene desaturase